MALFFRSSAVLLLILLLLLSSCNTKPTFDIIGVDDEDLPDIAPDNLSGQVLFYDDYRVTLFNPKNNKIRTLYEGQDIAQATISPDKNWLALVFELPPRIEVRNVTSGALDYEYSLPFFANDYVAWLPNSTQLIRANKPQYDPMIAVLDRDGSTDITRDLLTVNDVLIEVLVGGTGNLFVNMERRVYYSQFDYNEYTVVDKFSYPGFNRSNVVFAVGLDFGCFKVSADEQYILYRNYDYNRGNTGFYYSTMATEFYNATYMPSLGGEACYHSQFVNLDTLLVYDDIDVQQFSLVTGQESFFSGSGSSYSVDGFQYIP